MLPTIRAVCFGILAGADKITSLAIFVTIRPCKAPFQVLFHHPASFTEHAHYRKAEDVVLARGALGGSATVAADAVGLCCVYTLVC